ncbi:MAG TPA: hypothetical protein PLW88_07485 [Syntrophorhabdaceae bacterium]|nr:hypothetical protein [Syntrophorhabdaceae bacterium]
MAEVALLQQMVEKLGLSHVADAIGYNKTAVCHVLKGTYRGKPDKILKAVENKFSQQPVECPVLGRIALARCVEERNKPFAPVNPLRVRLIKTCKSCREYLKKENNGEDRNKAK